MNEREIFEHALQFDEFAERDQFLERACRDNPALRQRIESLLAASQRDDSFLALPDTQLVDEPSQDAAVGQAIGPYKLLENIGEGGFGVVYMAEQQKPVRRTVAIKVIKPGMDSRQVIARFEAERQALAMMDHPHITKVLDAGTTSSGRPYFVMELVKGVPITTYCDQRRLTLPQRLQLFVSVCQAIQHAHSKGVIHRDIKPGNVLVAAYDDRPIVKVIDFGIAKATGQQLTEATLHTGFGAVVGSMEYMSPEQASFNQLDIDTRSDVYSLGVLLYELLTGSPPLTTEQLRQIGLLESLKTIREQEPPRPSMRVSTDEGLPSLAASRSTEPARLAALLRGDLDWVVMKAIDKNRDRRYETVSGLAAEIERYLTGNPVLAHPPSLVYQFRKWSWKHRGGVAASLVALVLFLVAGVSWVYRIDQQTRQRAEHSSRVAAALDDAAQKLGAAIGAPIGSQAEWIAARASADRINELMRDAPVQQEVAQRAGDFLSGFEAANQDRELAEQIENVVMTSATHEDLASWERMDRQFQELFANYGIDFGQQTATEVAKRIREHRSTEQLCDALELWIGTRGQLSAMGGPAATRETMQPWAEALLAADDHPVRTGIRRLIYAGTLPTIAQIDAVIEGVDLNALSPRTLSWLATTYAMAGGIDESDDVFALATRLYPSDLMLNFDYAYTLAGQQRWAMAIRYYLRCVAVRPSVSGPWRGLGNAYRENDEYEASRDSLLEAIRWEPDYGPIHLDLARTLLKLGEPAEAESHARQAMELGHATVDVTLVRSLALMELDRYPEALVLLNKCLENTQDSAAESSQLRQLKKTCQHKLAESIQARDE